MPPPVQPAQPGGSSGGSPPRAGQPGELPPPLESGPPGSGAPGGGPPIQGGGGGFSNEIGEPGLRRLFNHQLAGQISWLLPLALVGCLAAAWQTRLRFPLDRHHQNLLLWLAWLAPMAVFFSVANLFHRYYLEMLAPAIAALVGAGIAALWNDYRQRGWRGWLLPLALLGSAGVEAAILAEFPEWSRWLAPLVVGLCLAVAAVLAVVRLLRVRQPGVDARPWPRALAGVGVLALLIPLAVWSFIPVWYGGHSGLPYAGPDLLEEPRRSGSPATDGDNRLLDYLLANRGEAAYLAASMNAQTAAPIILATGEPVMALGGFSGGDPILSREDLEGLVADGAVRFFLLSPQRDRQRDLARWVAARCEIVPAREWGGAPPNRGEPLQLFDCW
jgi:4-amino-4-deoxy-L-arabinose transferase-like glycosyltransferase